ncbi:thiamineS protein [Ammonifex degensii KC4]|uniref:ThiamineS protein n=1 Tax=Ammonifex degensii (strain DSM 10501 / KC4) TaxID=429009 RepID=C9RBD4_AMMDK|nr:MoaD/ThiS family protein [Ammonifex degensii]ACX51561.1 thiamineS protein [Ammonifex degensii KC4]
MLGVIGLLQIEVRAFSFLYQLFKERGWSQPYLLGVPEGCTLAKLLEVLEIPAEKVEAVLVNGRVRDLDYELQEGDRVGLVPPGTPGPYRVLLGFVKGCVRADDLLL